MNSMKDADQLPVDRFLPVGRDKARIMTSIRMPESSRMLEKLAASMESSPNANRHKIELPAKARRAKVVRAVILITDVIADAPGDCAPHGQWFAGG